MNVQGKIAIVTGAATGIGAAIAEALVAEGATVIGLDIAWKGGDVADSVEQVHCDVANADSVKACFADIEVRHGRIDILVNNAALATAVAPKPFEQYTSEEWSRIVTINTLAPFLCTQAVAPGMRARKSGRIINLTSGTIFQAVPNNLPYIASKGAIAVMTRSLARELGRDNVTVNAIAPGLTMTQGIASNPGYPEEMRSRVVSSRCIPREETAEDVVGACIFLASDGAAFLTGQIITVDGGLAFH